MKIWIARSQWNFVYVQICCRFHSISFELTNDSVCMYSFHENNSKRNWTIILSSCHSVQYLCIVYKWCTQSVTQAFQIWKCTWRAQYWNELKWNEVRPIDAVIVNWIGFINPIRAPDSFYPFFFSILICARTCVEPAEMFNIKNIANTRK